MHWHARIAGTVPHYVDLVPSPCEGLHTVLLFVPEFDFVVVILERGLAKPFPQLDSIMPYSYAWRWCRV